MTKLVTKNIFDFVYKKRFFVIRNIYIYMTAHWRNEEDVFRQCTRFFYHYPFLFKVRGVIRTCEKVCEGIIVLIYLGKWHIF